VFIDADKRVCAVFPSVTIELACLTFICDDNTGHTAAVERTQNGLDRRRVNRVVKNDPRVEQVLPPVRDGLTIIGECLSTTVALPHFWPAEAEASEPPISRLDLTLNYFRKAVFRKFLIILSILFGATACL